MPAHHRVRPRTMLRMCNAGSGVRVHVCIGAASLALAGGLACKPSVDVGCELDADCERGEMCELASAACIDRIVDTTSTESPAPASFTAKPVPFFRGRVCTVHDVQAGAKIPVRLDPCFHPCLASGTHHFKHYFSCLGKRCEAWATMYVDADSVADGCPADAFGQFDPAMCVYNHAIDLAVEVKVRGEPVIGTVALEVPFLSNADAAEIAPRFDDAEFINSKIDYYPQDPTRLVGGMPINLGSASPVPPASCADGACPCYDIGL